MYKKYRKILKCNDKVFNYNLMVEFFKHVELYDPDLFKRIRKRSRYFELDGYLYNPPIGCYYDLDDDKISSYKVSLPNINDTLTMLINVHEMIHALMIESRIGHKYDSIVNSEIYSKIYEYYYILYLNDDTLIQKYNIYLDMLYNSTDQKHKDAIKEFYSIKNDISKSDSKILQKSKKIVLNMN